MQAVRSYVTTGAALVAAGVLAITPIAPPPPDVHIASPGTRLTAASASIANIPVNVIQAIANVPANEIAAMQSMADALLFTGSWWTGRPNQIWGTDPADPPKWKAGVAMLVPFPALSGPLGKQLAVFSEAEFPVNPSCHYICSDPIPILQGLFQVPLSQLISGYTFPTVVNPLGPVEGEFGFPGTGPGNTMPWSNTTVKLDPTEPLTSLIASLVNPPTGITIVSPQAVVKTVINLAEAIVISFSPFTPGGPFTPGWPYSRAACPSCPPNSGQNFSGLQQRLPTFIENAAAPLVNIARHLFLPSGGDVQQNVVKNAVTRWDPPTASGTFGPAPPPEAPSTAARVSDTGSRTVAPQALKWLHRPRTLVEKLNSTTTTSTDVTRDGAKVEPGQLDGKGTTSTDVTRDGAKVEPGQLDGKGATSRGRLAGAVKSVSDRISSTISARGDRRGATRPKVTDGLKRRRRRDWQSRHRRHQQVRYRL